MKNSSATGTFRLFGLLAVLAVIPSCVSQKKYKDALGTAENYKTLWEGVKDHQLEIESENRDLRARLAVVGIETARPDAEIKEAQHLREEYQRRLQSLDRIFQGVEGVDQGDVTLLRTDYGEVYRIKDAILFDAGSAEVKAAGKTVVQKIAEQIKNDGRFIRVEGHTDSDPVVRTKNKWPYGNLQLSSARAMEVAHFLIESGIPEDKISIGGYGPFRPIAANDSAASKKQNRRVEIVVLDAGSE